MEHIYKTHLLHLFETELATYHRENGEPMPLVQTFELCPMPDDFITYNVLYKLYKDYKNDGFYIAKVRITHNIEVVATKPLGQILEGLK